MKSLPSLNRAQNVEVWPRRDGADQHLVLAAYRCTQFGDRHRFAFDEFDEHHVHVVENDLADAARIDSGRHQPEASQPLDELAGLVDQRLVQARE